MKEEGATSPGLKAILVAKNFVSDVIESAIDLVSKL